MTKAEQQEKEEAERRDKTILHLIKAMRKAKGRKRKTEKATFNERYAGAMLLRYYECVEALRLIQGLQNMIYSLTPRYDRAQTSYFEVEKSLFNSHMNEAMRHLLEMAIVLPQESDVRQEVLVEVFARRVGYEPWYDRHKRAPDKEILRRVTQWDAAVIDQVSAAYKEDNLLGRHEEIKRTVDAVTKDQQEEIARLKVLLIDYRQRFMKLDPLEKLVTGIPEEEQDESENEGTDEG